MTLTPEDIAAIAAAVAVARREATPLNDEEIAIDEDALRELARRDAEKMRRARNR